MAGFGPSLETPRWAVRLRKWGSVIGDGVCGCVCGSGSYWNITGGRTNGFKMLMDHPRPSLNIVVELGWRIQVNLSGLNMTEVYCFPCRRLFRIWKGPLRTTEYSLNFV